MVNLKILSLICLAGSVVASWSLMQEVEGSNPFTVMTNIFVTEFAKFSENIKEKLQWFIGYTENVFDGSFRVTLAVALAVFASKFCGFFAPACSCHKLCH